jgi:hypothetical protein
MELLSWLYEQVLAALASLFPGADLWVAEKVDQAAAIPAAVDRWIDLATYALAASLFIVAASIVAMVLVPRYLASRSRNDA